MHQAPGGTGKDGRTLAATTQFVYASEHSLNTAAASVFALC